MRLFRHKTPPAIRAVTWAVPNLSTATISMVRDEDGHVLVMARDAFGTPRVVYDSRREAESELPGSSPSPG